MQLSRNIVLSFLVFLLSAIFTPVSLAASNPQTEVSTTASDSNRKFIISQIYDDVGYLLGERDFYLLVGGLYASPSVLEDAFETESNGLGQKWGHSRFADSFFELGEVFGDETFPIALSVAGWGIGKFSGSQRLQNFGYDLIRAQAANGLLTIALKGIVNRTRPDGAPYSYPSGHTSSAFTTAGVVYKHFGKAWGIPAFALATFVGVSRLQENKHFVSDIFAGAILGTYVSLKLSGHSTKGSSLSFAPFYFNDAKGLRMALNF